MKLDFHVVPLILVDTLNAVEGAGLNVRPTNEQLQLDGKQSQSIWRNNQSSDAFLMQRNGGITYGRKIYNHNNSRTWLSTLQSIR